MSFTDLFTDFVFQDIEMSNKDQALQNIEKCKQDLLLDPHGEFVHTNYLKAAVGLTLIYAKENNFAASLAVLEQTEQLLKNMPGINNDYTELFALYGFKAKTQLVLNDVEKAKEAMLKSKEMLDKMESKSEFKQILYLTYYEYYSHSSIDNFKKSILNYAGWFMHEFRRDSPSALMIMDEFAKISNMCLLKKAYRQNEYILRIIRAFLEDKKGQLIDSDVYELKLTLEELYHMCTLLIDFVGLQYPEQAKLIKFNNYFLSFEFPGVPDAGDQLFDGSIKEYSKSKLLEMYIPIKLKCARTEMLLENVRPKLTPFEADSIKQKIKAARDMLNGMVTFKTDFLTNLFKNL